MELRRHQLFVSLAYWSCSRTQQTAPSCNPVPQLCFVPNRRKMSFSGLRFTHTVRFVAMLAFLLAGSGVAQAKLKESDAKQPSADAAGIDPSSAESHNGFFTRLKNFYRDDWSDSAESAPEPERRIPPAPIDSPPFPFSDWQYGGAPVIGAPDANVYPLMQALNGASSKIKVYGWVEPSVNVSTSRHTLFPSAYNIYSDTVVLDQAVLYIERLTDTVQTDHVEWGFHLTGFYGVDYRFTTAKGWLSQQLLKFNRQYAFDPILEYPPLSIPRAPDPTNLHLARHLSIPDI